MPLHKDGHNLLIKKMSLLSSSDRCSVDYRILSGISLIISRLFSWFVVTCCFSISRIHESFRFLSVPSHLRQKCSKVPGEQRVASIRTRRWVRSSGSGMSCEDFNDGETQSLVFVSAETWLLWSCVFAVTTRNLLIFPHCTFLEITFSFQ